MNAIAAISQNNIIGYNDGSLISKPSFDIKFFKMMTSYADNNIIVMGRKTWETFNNKLLPNRNHIVISKSILPKQDNFKQYFTFNQNCQYSFTNSEDFKNIDNNCWLIGGGQLYQSGIPYCQNLLITRLKNNVSEENAIKFPYEHSQLMVMFSHHEILSETSEYTIELYSKSLNSPLKKIAFIFANNNETENKGSVIYKRFKDIAKSEYIKIIPNIGWALILEHSFHIYVIPEYRRKGIATSLIFEFLTDFKNDLKEKTLLVDGRTEAKKLFWQNNVFQFINNNIILKIMENDDKFINN